MSYSQIKAMWSITRGSLRSITRSPSAMIFSFIFPFVFILVFGFIGNGGGKQRFKVALDKNSDTLNILYKTLKLGGIVKFVEYKDEARLQADLEEGNLAGKILIVKNSEIILLHIEVNLLYQKVFESYMSSILSEVK